MSLDGRKHVTIVDQFVIGRLSLDLFEAFDPPSWPILLLQVANVAQLKYVEDEDLVDLGMTKPEMRRLKKYFRRECPQGRLSKLKKVCVPIQMSHLPQKIKLLTSTCTPLWNFRIVFNEGSWKSENEVE